MIVLILLSTIQVAFTLPDLRSIGGRESLPDEFPYVVCIENVFEAHTQILYLTICSGSALTPTWTLTAAHCIFKNNTERYYTKSVIRYGPNENPHRSDITKTVVHRNSVIIDRYGVQDIGLVNSQVMNLPSFGKLSAVDRAALVGTAAISAGFGIGYNDSDKTVTSDRVLKPLHVLDVLIVKCDRNSLVPGLCSTTKCGARASLCPGDSGGPVIHSSGIVGVHSNGFTRCNRAKEFREPKFYLRFASVSTPVSPYLDWILYEITH